MGVFYLLARLLVPRFFPAVVRETSYADGTRVRGAAATRSGTLPEGMPLPVGAKQAAQLIDDGAGATRTYARDGSLVYATPDGTATFTPQGTLAERLRAGGAGIAAFYTKTGVGTMIAEGKPTAQFGGETYILERGIVADVALVHAQRGDPAGNLIYHGTARNFNPVIATAGRITIAEVEAVDDHYIDPERVITPGVFVDRIVTATPRPAEIERRTVRPRPASALRTGD